MTYYVFSKLYNVELWNMKIYNSQNLNTDIKFGAIEFY